MISNAGGKFFTKEIAMKDKLKNYKNYILPFLFSVIITYWTMNSLFITSKIKMVIMIFFTNVFLSFICIYIKDKGIKGGVIFTLTSVIYTGIAFIAINTSGYGDVIDYILWFINFTLENSVHVEGFYYGTALLTSYFFSCTVFYFTCIRFRISSVFLIAIIPLLLQYTKTDSNVRVSFIVFLILFFLLYIEKVRRESVYRQKKGFFQIDKWYLSSALVFVLISVLFSVILPKPVLRPRLADLDKIISQTIDPVSTTVQNIMKNNEILNMFNPVDYDKNRHIGAVTAPLTEKVLFEVEAEEPLYLKSRSWDKYENNRWTIENEVLAEGYDLEVNITRLMKLEAITRLIKRLEGANEEFNELINVVENKKYDLVSNKERKATIELNYSMENNFIVSEEVTNVKFIDDKKVYKNELGFCFLDRKGSSYRYDMYCFNYVFRRLDYLSTQFQVMRLLDKDTVSLLYEYKDYALEGESIKILKYGEEEANHIIKEKKILDETIKEMNIAYDNFINLPEQLPKRIYTLAEEITTGEISDYEKASAIEQFFHTSEFVYDLSPPRSPNNKDYIDFFIFDSKSGICIHYATAMVILARAAGLPARYVEGYVSYEIDEETGKYLVREKHGHAFPEVYIAGYGWMVFEPTVSTERANEFLLFLANLKERIQDITSHLWVVFLDTPLWMRLLLIPYLIFMLWVFLKIFVYIGYSLWEKRIYKYDRKKALEKIFGKTEAVLKKIDLEIKKHETPSNYADRLLKDQEINIYSLANNFNKSKYGGIEPTKEDIKDGVNMFKDVKKHVKRNIGKLKATFI